jgi:hypothetical protein
MINMWSNNIDIYIFYWHQVSEAFALTILGGAQALSKEFPASVSRVIQEAIKFPQSDYTDIITVKFFK